MNIGTAAVEALARLKHNPDWTTVCNGMHDAVRKVMNDALTSPPDARVHATSYAAGMRDTWVTMVGATEGKVPNQVEKPGPEGSRVRRAAPTPPPGGTEGNQP